LKADFERTSTVPLPSLPRVSYVPEPLGDDDADAGADDADGGAEPEDTASATDAGDDAGEPDEGVRLGELLPGFGKRKLDAPPDFSMTAVDIARLLYLVDDRSVHDRMYALAQDPKRDRGLRQVAIGYLAYQYDKRARDLVDSDALTPAQRTEVKRVVFGPPPSDASAPPPAPAPGRRRHHRHL
jgi:hypothetical protein